MLEAPAYIRSVASGAPSMKSRKILDDLVGNARVLLEAYEDTKPRLHDYDIPRLSWIRAVRFIRHFGLKRALDVVDERANRAADRGDYETSRRWRTLITAIHAMQEDERLPGDNVH
jgi:hypothetical protein